MKLFLFPPKPSQTSHSKASQAGQWCTTTNLRELRRFGFPVWEKTEEVGLFFAVLRWFAEGLTDLAGLEKNTFKQKGPSGSKSTAGQLSVAFVFGRFRCLLVGI